MSAFGTPKNSKECARERSDQYNGVVCVINDRWRVIVCKDGIQWILQKSKSGGGHGRAWRGVSYLTTKRALIEACAQHYGHCETAAPAVLEALPDRISQYRHVGRHNAPHPQDGQR
jgi:hypothetical protein